MCIGDSKTNKHRIIELRSENAYTNLGGTAYKNTYVRFGDMDFKGFLSDHPEGDRGLWNVKVAYFGFYQALGIDNAEAIDISIDEITSPFTLSSRPGSLTLGTANVDITNDIDNTGGSEVLPCGFFIGDSEGITQTCRIKFTDWNVKIQGQRGGINSILESTGGGGDNIISEWVLRLDVSPYLSK